MPKKPAAPEPESCGTCKYFQANPDDHYGYCRRNPPAFVVDDEGGCFTQPPVEDAEWCGCYIRLLQS